MAKSAKWANIATSSGKGKENVKVTACSWNRLHPLLAYSLIRVPSLASINCISGSYPVDTCPGSWFYRAPQKAHVQAYHLARPFARRGCAACLHRCDCLESALAPDWLLTHSSTHLEHFWQALPSPNSVQSALSEKCFGRSMVRYHQYYQQYQRLHSRP